MAHICFVIPRFEVYSPESGGAISTVTKGLSQRLTKQGHQISIISRGGANHYYDEGDVHLLRYRPDTPRARFAVLANRIRRKLGLRATDDRYLADVARCLASFPAPDVLVLANDYDAAMRFSARSPRLVLWLHNYPEGPLGQALNQLPHNVHFIAVSHAVAEWTIEHCGIARDRIDVVYNGVDLDRFHPIEIDQPSSELEPLRVICHGRLDPNKGHQTAARAVALLRERGLAVEFTLVGEVSTFGMSDEIVSAYLAELESALRDSGAQRLGRVPHDELPEILAHHDIACYLPISDEPFSLAALEAMACGCAVIVRPSGGLAEVVGDAAATVGPNDPDAVAAVIEGFALDRDRLAAARLRSRDRALEFPWLRSATTFSEILATDTW